MSSFNRLRPGSPHRKSHKPRKGTQRVGDLIKGVIRSKGLGKKASQLDTIAAAWGEAVGLKNARQTKLHSFSKGVLVVDVSSAALAHELGVYYKHSLIKRLSLKTKVAIKDLRCRISGEHSDPQKQAQ